MDRVLHETLLSHGIVDMWIVPIELASIVISSQLILIANEITPSGSGVDISWDCCLMGCGVLVETLISHGIVAVMTLMVKRI